MSRADTTPSIEILDRATNHGDGDVGVPILHHLQAIAPACPIRGKVDPSCAQKAQTSQRQTGNVHVAVNRRVGLRALPLLREGGHGAGSWLLSVRCKSPTAGILSKRVLWAAIFKGSPFLGLLLGGLDPLSKPLRQGPTLTACSRTSVRVSSTPPLFQTEISPMNLDSCVMPY